MKVKNYTTLKKSKNTLRIIVLCGSVALLPLNGYTASAFPYKGSPERVKMGEVIAVNHSDRTVVINASTTEITGHYDTDTLFYLGSGKGITASEIQLGQILYLFGSLTSSTTTDMNIHKVVVRNTSKLLRKVSHQGGRTLKLSLGESKKIVSKNSLTKNQGIKSLVRDYILEY